MHLQRRLLGFSAESGLLPIAATAADLVAPAVCGCDETRDSGIRIRHAERLANRSLIVSAVAATFKFP